MQTRLPQMLRPAGGAAGRRPAPRPGTWILAALNRVARLLGIDTRVRRDRAELSRLDDHMLRDIGVSRWDVERIRVGDYERHPSL